MHTKIKTYLPVFPGFYDTLWDFTNGELEADAEYLSTEEGKTEAEIEAYHASIDYTAYRHDLARIVTKIIGHRVMVDFPGIKSVTFESLYSPREYNYGNDSINVLMEVDLEEHGAQMRRFLKENASEWEDYLKDTCKSRSGFISFYPHTAREWAGETAGYTKVPDNKAVWFTHPLDFYYSLNERMEEEVREYTYEAAVCNGYCMVTDYAKALEGTASDGH